MKNKVFLWLLLIMGVTFVSCSDEQDGISSLTSNEKLMSDKLTLDDSDEAVALQLTPKMKELQKKMKSSLRLLTRASNTYGEDYDENFESNIFAIRELPVTIEARGVGNDASRKYFFCNQARDEVKLSNTYSPSDQSQQFYLKVLPASSGIPYLIYSESSNTPLVVGHYRKHPDVNILMANSDDNISNAMASWNLIASDYPGYFAIENEMYIGQSDPKNSWSIFYYVLEVNNNDEIRYGKYAKKPQQEFLIQPKDSFIVDYIDFDKSTAKVNRRVPLEVVSYGKNVLEQEQPFTIKAAHYVTKTSRFSENSILKIPFKNSKLFYCPKVEAEHLVVPSPVKPEDLEQKDFERNIQYSNRTQSVNVPLIFDVNGTAKPNSLIEATSWLENYDVSVQYTAYMSYKYKDGDVRNVKIKGTWYGTLYTTKRAQPDIIKFFDLDDGEELSLIRKKMFNFSKTVLK
ncbi:MAG: hypothetical protein LKH27_01160 [Prevotella sp.]|nr:hypothetical protein [Prevotella sp.]MCI1472995.1 hypothetical protein [Prevotella sp.]MCI1518850.1 hypothetical protein [Prevotella sp.]MCI1548818.1 hypothetical protein [Prevotella sp.]MCI1594963.1 hypothetical protein [Prevotella sp.]MCI2088677.1 hypothetical protein [Prevotella sp.]